MIRGKIEVAPKRSHLHCFPQGCPGKACFLGLFPFFLVPSIDPAANVMGASGWALGSRPVAALCHHLQPILQLWPRQQLRCCLSGCLPIHPSVHISIPLYGLVTLVIFPHKSTMLVFSVTWVSTFNLSFWGVVPQRVWSRGCWWEQGERALWGLVKAATFRIIKISG